MLKRVEEELSSGRKQEYLGICQEDQEATKKNEKFESTRLPSNNLDKTTGMPERYRKGCYKLPTYNLFTIM